MDKDNQIKVDDYCQHKVTGRIFLCSERETIWGMSGGGRRWDLVLVSHELINNVLHPLTSTEHYLETLLNLYEIKKYNNIILNGIIHDL